MSDSSDSEDEMVPGLVAASNGHEVMDVEDGGEGDVGDDVDDDDYDDDDGGGGDDVVFQVMDEECEGEEMYIDSLGQALDLFSPKTFPTAEECMEHCR